MNLSTNAYHAMERDGGTLSVRLREVELGTDDLYSTEMTPGYYAKLTVTDTGVGMDKHLAQQIFDPFFSTKDVGKGTGLGLSVVHGIVASMKGSIQVVSKPGEGTRLDVCFPISAEQTMDGKKGLDEPVMGGCENILLIDDENSVTKVEKSILERLGYQVTASTDSLEALKIFNENPGKFDLIISDLAMPKMPGDKLSLELKKIRSDIPILICTGFSDSFSEEKARQCGIRGCLMKPIVKNDLANKIREILDRGIEFTTP